MRIPGRGRSEFEENDHELAGMVHMKLLGILLLSVTLTAAAQNVPQELYWTMSWANLIPKTSSRERTARVHV